jgi:hypothetical protein
MSKNGQKAKFLLNPGQTVGDLVQKVALKFHYDPSSVRLFFSGRELKPFSAPLDRFEIGKFENYLIHLSTTTIEIFESSVPSTSAPCETVDLTASTSDESLVDLTSTSPLIRERKKRRLLSDIAPINEDALVSLHNVSNKQLRINISRALNHRLCILENRILNHSSQSSMCSEISVEFLVQDSGVGKSYFVKVDHEVSCQCENTSGTPCQHILFILMKVGLHPCFFHDIRCFDYLQIILLSSNLQSLFRVQHSTKCLSQKDTFPQVASNVFSSHLSPSLSPDSGVVYCGTRAPTFNSASHNDTPNFAPPIVVEEPECSVCLRTLIIPPERYPFHKTLLISFSFESGDELVACRKCHNKLHQYCVQQWLQRSQTCPNCRFPWKIPNKKPANKTSQMIRSPPSSRLSRAR